MKETITAPSLSSGLSSKLWVGSAAATPPCGLHECLTMCKAQEESAEEHSGRNCCPRPAATQGPTDRAWPAGEGVGFICCCFVATLFFSPHPVN